MGLRNFSFTRVAVPAAWLHEGWPLAEPAADRDELATSDTLIEQPCS